MSNYQVVIELGDGSEYVKGGLSLEAAEAVKGAVEFVLEGVKALWVEPEGVWRLETDGGAGEAEVLEVLVLEDNEEDWPVLSEYEQGWANIRAEERAAVQRQNREDAEYARQQSQVPSYQGVRGSREPDGTWIFEP